MEQIRKPCERWPDVKEEDLFRCIKCNDWYPWFKYRNSYDILVKHLKYTDRILCTNCKPRHHWKPSDDE